MTNLPEDSSSGVDPQLSILDQIVSKAASIIDEQQLHTHQHDDVMRLPVTSSTLLSAIPLFTKPKGSLLIDNNRIIQSSLSGITHCIFHMLLCQVCLIPLSFSLSIQGNLPTVCFASYQLSLTNVM